MTDQENLVPKIEELAQSLSRAHAEIAKAIIGQDEVIRLVLAAILCRGHGLLIGLPGLGKTRLIETVARVLGLDGARIQFTPDLMPADILGSEVLDTDADGKRHFRFVEGPVFCQLLMADEINRASPRTQSALLQAMQEQAVAIAGRSRPLPQPFSVLATQNPIEQEGTYPLPEAQLDRFLFQIDVRHPGKSDERKILLATTGAEETGVEPVLTAPDIIKAQDLLRRMPIGDAVVDHIIDVVRCFRPDDETASEKVRTYVAWGPGPRASQALMLGVRARALLDGRLAPSSEDVEALAPSALAHRMGLNFSARAAGITATGLVADQLQQLTGFRKTG